MSGGLSRRRFIKVFLLAAASRLLPPSRREGGLTFGGWFRATDGRRLEFIRLPWPRGLWPMNVWMWDRALTDEEIALSIENWSFGGGDA